jgi:hypothetical protein
MKSKSRAKGGGNKGGSDKGGDTTDGSDDESTAQSPDSSPKVGLDETGKPKRKMTKTSIAKGAGGVLAGSATLALGVATGGLGFVAVGGVAAGVTAFSSHRKHRKEKAAAQITRVDSINDVVGFAQEWVSAHPEVDINQNNLCSSFQDQMGRALLDEEVAMIAACLQMRACGQKVVQDEKDKEIENLNISIQQGVENDKRPPAELTRKLHALLFATGLVLGMPFKIHANAAGGGEGGEGGEDGGGGGAAAGWVGRLGGAYRHGGRVSLELELVAAAAATLVVIWGVFALASQRAKDITKKAAKKVVSDTATSIIPMALPVKDGARLVSQDLLAPSLGTPSGASGISDDPALCGNLPRVQWGNLDMSTSQMKVCVLRSSLDRLVCLVCGLVHALGGRRECGAHVRHGLFHAVVWSFESCSGSSGVGHSAAVCRCAERTTCPTAKRSRPWTLPLSSSPWTCSTAARSPSATSPRARTTSCTS